MEECNICAEGFTKSTRRPIECFHCHEKACAKCVERYLLETTQNAHCMHCRTEWDRMFMSGALSKVFMIRSFKEHREKMLLERERSMLPQAAQLLPYIHNMDELEKEQTELARKMAKINRQIGEISRQIHSVRRQYETDRHAIMYNRTINEKTEEEKDGFNRPCVHPDCPGYLQGRTGKCLSCLKFTCLKCNMPKGHEHECKESDIKEWDEIRRTTKPCPSCHVRIFKISGCAQMWCPQCHTAFNWDTGKIETGAIHNPHYYEWMFANPNHHHENGGGGGCHEGVLVSIFRLKLDKRCDYGVENYAFMVSQYHRLVQHCQHDLLYQLERQTNERSVLSYKMDLRLDYLLKKITEDQFKNRLQRKEKDVQKRLEAIRVVNSFCMMMIDTFRWFSNDQSLPLKDLINRFRVIVPLTNEGIDNINKHYQSKMIKRIPMPEEIVLVENF